MLMPAAVLVMVILGALVVDQAHVFLAQRELSNAAQAAATDAASQLDSAEFYGTGRIGLDPGSARRVALASIQDQSLDGLTLIQQPDVAVAGRQVCVSLSARVRPIFGAALGRLSGSITVSARSTATAAGDEHQSVPQRTIC
jgi:Flp pilus assembly protein TadG